MTTCRLTLTIRDGVVARAFVFDACNLAFANGCRGTPFRIYRTVLCNDIDAHRMVVNITVSCELSDEAHRQRFEEEVIALAAQKDRHKEKPAALKETLYVGWEV